MPKGVLVGHAFVGFCIAIYAYAVVATPAICRPLAAHGALALGLGVVWTLAWVLIKGLARIPPWSEQPEPGWGGWLLVAVVLAWQTLGFIALGGQSLGSVGCVGVLGFPFIGTVALTGAAWLGAGIRFNVAAWITACVIGIPCSLGFLYVFGGAMNGL